MDEIFRPKSAEEVRQRWDEERQEAQREAQVPAPAERTGTIVEDLEDGDTFSVDGGRTWYVCAVVMFGAVAVYVESRRDDDAPTIRVDAERNAACLVGVRQG